MTPVGLLLVGAGTALATWALGPATMAALRRFDVMDVPNDRSSHRLPTLRGGGLAVLAGILLTALVAQAAGQEVPWVALAACFVLSFVGLCADVTQIGPLPRLVAQMLVGAAAGSMLGDHTTALLGAVAAPVLVNVVNFMDGINGITGLTMVAWAVIVVTGARADSAVLLAVLALGGALGFLPWNAVRTRLFLGDVGSYLFGGLIAMCLLLESSAGGHPVLVLAATVPYLLDTGLTLLRRIARRAPLTQAHREHFYQRLSRRPGWTHLRVAVAMSGAALATGSLALMVVGQNGML